MPRLLGSGISKRLRIEADKQGNALKRQKKTAEGDDTVVRLSALFTRRLLRKVLLTCIQKSIKARQTPEFGPALTVSVRSAMRRCLHSWSVCPC